MQRLTYLLIITFLQSLSIVDNAPVSSNEKSPVNFEEYGGGVEGDMYFDYDDDNKTGRGVAIRPTTIHRWPNGIVPYEFAANISTNHTPLIVQKLRELENVTAVNGVPCITFRERNASDATYILILNGTGCSSRVGGGAGATGPRPLSLLHSSAGTCMIGGTIQHEFLHALGFYHEQSRPDRDTYVNIQWSNIVQSSAFNFDKYNDSQVDTQMTPYDYGSVMHYGATAFAINSSAPTIIPIFNSSANLGQRVGLSPIDILEVQRFYGCVATPTSTTTTRTTTTSVITTTTTATTTTSVITTTTTATTTTTVITTTITATTATTVITTTTTVITTTTTSVTTVTVVVQAADSNVFPFYQASPIPLLVALLFHLLTI